MSRLTEGYFARHYQGMRNARDAAMLDIAQDHALYLLAEAGLFERGLVFKGGTALRKYRAGTSGRFSTDLDFAAADEALALDVLDALDGVDTHGFTFAIDNVGEDGRRGDLRVTTPFGSPNLGAKIELARHPLSLAPELLPPVPLPIHRAYGITVPTVPVVRLPEAVAEKLARFRRVSLARDLYDLQWFALQGALDEPLVRRLWVLKTHRDVVDDGRGQGPIDPADVLRPRSAKEFDREDIGYLTQPVRMDQWIETVRARYAFLADLDDDEQRWCQCDRRDEYAVTAELRAIGLRDPQ